MAIIERPVLSEQSIAVIPPATPSSAMGALKRPVVTKGWRQWVFTVDHKKLGIMYMVTAMFFFWLAVSKPF